MTPEELTHERTRLITACDTIVDSYHAGSYTTGEDLTNLLTMRRDLSANGSRLASHVKQVYGNAGLTYLMRKYEIADAVIKARAMDTTQKAPAMNVLEMQAQKLPSVVEAQKAEIMAESEKEALKTKLDWYRQVLGSMTQDISVLAHEMKHTHFQTEGK